MAINYKTATAYSRNKNDSLGIDYWTKDVNASERATAGNAARAYQGAADNAIEAGIGAAGQAVSYARQGIDAVTGLTDSTNKAKELLNKNYELATGAAGRMSGNIQKVEAAAAALNPYAAQINDMADTLWNQGLGIANAGRDYMGQGQSLLSLDPNAGGIVGQYISWLDTIDPNKYVSMAASDVQNSYTNAQGQLTRTLTRAGDDASSTRTATAQQQWAQSLAAALAGAKTRARMQGLSEQGAALKDALSTAQNMITAGVDIQKAGAGIEQEAVTDKNAAAGIVAKSGELSAAAGSLQASQSSAYTQAGKLMSEYANISQSNANAIVNAYGNAANAAKALSDAQARAGTYYAQVAQGYGSMAGDMLFAGLGVSNEGFHVSSGLNYVK